MDQHSWTPWIETPLIRSKELSEAACCNVFLKLECVQPSGSFKLRGIGNFVLRVLQRQRESVTNGDQIQNNEATTAIHFYSSSGGNAGLACVHAAVAVGCRATIIVPLSTSSFMIKKLRAAGATDVIQIGASWAEADKHLREVVMEDARNLPDGQQIPVYVPPFDSQDVWDGHATMIPEVLRELQGIAQGYRRTDDKSSDGEHARTLPDAVICSVGGGGLLSGICQGIDVAGLSSHTKVIAMETLGADSFSQAVRKGELITLPQITSIATTLGARTVCQKALEYGMRDMIVSQVVNDAAAVEGCRTLAEKQRLLVEPSCGVCIAPLLDGSLKKLVPSLHANSNVVVVVCGGTNISLEILSDYVQRYSSDRSAN